MSHLAQGDPVQSAFSLAEKPLLEIVTQVRNGLPAAMFEHVASTLGLSVSTLAAKLGIARHAVTRKRGNRAPLSSETSESFCEWRGCAISAARSLRRTKRYRNGCRSPMRAWAIWRHGNCWIPTLALAKWRIYCARSLMVTSSEVHEGISHRGSALHTPTVWWRQ